ncbi:hypothetical protein [Salinarimonas sp.]|uniref:hypothetical protein n=1 Tax=Salinarimonas sp. TaxID=2766526 RepID=UPI00391AC092
MNAPTPLPSHARAALAPNLLFARATQLAADGIAMVDQKIAQVGSIGVDPAIAPALAGDLATLNATLGGWKSALRAQTLSTMKSLVVEDDGLAAAWAPVDRSSAPALLAFAKEARARIAVEEGEVATLRQALAPFSEGIDAALSRIKADMGTVSQELANANARAQALQQQANGLRDKIDDYKRHPWKLILAGVSLISLAEQLTSLITTIETSRKAVDRLQDVERQIAQLQAGQGPLLALSLALTGLSGGVANMVTALQQISAQLDQILATPQLPPIMAAQLETMMQDLAASRAIAAEIVAGT